MPSRFDHAIIAAGDLAEATRAFHSLGFVVNEGGRHPGRGTANAIIRFGLDYLELLALADEQEARASGLADAEVAEFARGGLMDFALASDDLAADIERLRGAGLTARGPFDGSRRRPDGSLLAWQSALIERGPSTTGAASGFFHARDPWPFLIEWRTPDAERLAREQPGVQPNGVSGVWGVMVIVRDLDATLPLYRDGLGLPLRERKQMPHLGAERARFTIGARETTIDLLAPTGEGEVQQALTSNGEGLYTVILATPDLAASQRYLAGARIPTSTVPGRSDELLLSPQAALGARLVLRSADRSTA